MATVRDLLETKGRGVLVIGPQQTVYDALGLMAEKDVGALVVAVNGGKIVGMVSERDYARKVILKGFSSRNLLVREIMTEEVVTVAPEATIEECMALMTQERVRHLPVVDRERLAGIISIGDVVKAVIADKESRIGQLEGYIMGG